MTGVLPDPLVSVLEEGRQVHLAVDSRHGPHVTPELYAWSGGRLWFAAATTTLKAKVLRRRPVAGAVVTVPGRSMVVSGEVTAYAPWRPLELAAHLRDLPAATRALAWFSLRNATDLAAFGRDTLTGRTGWRPPPPRTWFALRPVGAALVEGDRVVERWRWAVPQPVGTGRAEAAPSGGLAAVAALPGPVAVPGSWFPDDRILRVPAEVLGLAGLPRRFPMSVVTDEYRAPGPAAKRGALVRGEGWLDAERAGVVHVEPRRVVHWAGTETSSTPTG